MSTVWWLVIPLMALAAGLGKGGLGAAFAGTITPIASIFMPVREAIALLLPLFIAGDWLALWFYWRRWDVDEIRRLLPPALVGVILGSYLLTNLPTDTLRHLLGVISLTLAGYKLLEPRLTRLRYHYQPWHTTLTGVSGGAAAALASAGGPLVTAYLLLRQTKPLPFLGTTTLFFTVVNLSRLPALISAGVFRADAVQMIVICLPLVWVGVWLGRKLVVYINPVWFDRLMTALLALSGVILVVR